MGAYYEAMEYDLRPFRRFAEEEYHILIPLAGLKNLTYVPAYGEDYIKLGILELTYAVHPVMYVALRKLDMLAESIGVKFNIADAWRPVEIQQEKYNLNLQKCFEYFAELFPSERKSFDEWKEIYSKDKWQPYFDKLNGRSPEQSPTKFAAPDQGVTPHGAGVAIDIVMAKPEITTFQKKDKADKVIFECHQFDPFQRTKWLPSELDAVSHLEPLAGIPGLSKFNPILTTHQVARPDAPRAVKAAVFRSDFQSEMAASLYPIGRTNGEDWHYQVTGDYPLHYKNFTIPEAKSFSPERINVVKHELDRYASLTFGIFYDDQFRKLVPNNIREEKPFDENNIIFQSQLIKKLRLISKGISR